VLVRERQVHQDSLAAVHQVRLNHQRIPVRGSLVKPVQRQIIQHVMMAQLLAVHLAPQINSGTASRLGNCRYYIDLPSLRERADNI
jgi:hypothetical protein